MQFTLNTIEKFKTSVPEEVGSISLLFSGTIDPLSVGADLVTDPPTWVTGSWNWGDVSVGQLVSGSIVGITATNYDLNRTNNESLFKSCTELSFLLDKGNGNSSTVTVPVIGKTYYSDYTFFDVDVDVDALGCQVYFYKDSNDNFLGYSCRAFDGNPLSISILPSAVEYASEELASINPLLNNVMQSRLNSSTQNVELFTTQYRPAVTVYDGEDSTEYSSYDKILDGGSANVAFIEIEADGGRARPVYYIIYSKCTSLAEIEDSFYSSYANISGRFLGSKQSLVKWFTSSKEQYTKDNLQVVSTNSMEIPRTTYTTESLTTQSIVGNITGSIQFANKLYTGSLGEVKVSPGITESYYNEVDFGISMSTSESSLLCFYGNITTESVIGPEGVNTYGQLTIPQLSGYFLSSSYVNMYVRGTISGSITGRGTGIFSGSTYYCEPSFGTRSNPKCVTQDYNNESINLAYVSGSNLSGSFTGILTGYFTGLMNLTECSGTLSTDTFTGDILGHLSGSLLGPSLEIYSCKGTISGPINISPNTGSAELGARELEPTIVLEPQLVHEIVVTDRIANVSMEMAYYNVIPVDECFILPVESTVNYIDDVQDLIDNKVATRQRISFMLGTQYVSEATASGNKEYFTTRKTAGLPLAQKDYPEVGDIAYLFERRLGIKKIYIPEITTCYTVDYNGQIVDVRRLLRRTNTVEIETQNIFASSNGEPPTS